MRSRYAVPENGPVVETLRSERAAGGRPIVFHDIEYAAALLDPNLRGGWRVRQRPRGECPNRESRDGHVVRVTQQRDGARAALRADDEFMNLNGQPVGHAGLPSVMVAGSRLCEGCVENRQEDEQREPKTSIHSISSYRSSSNHVSHAFIPYTHLRI